MSQIEIDLIADPKLHHHITSNIRGGFKTAVNCLCTSNEKKSIIYLDYNSLYAYCMTYPLPVGGYKKLNQDEVKVFMDTHFKTYKGLNMTDEKGYWFLADIKVGYERIMTQTDELPLILQKHNIKEKEICHFN